MTSFLSTCSAEPLSIGAAMFPCRVHVPPGSLAEQGPQVHCVRGNGSHLASKFAYSGGGSSGFDVVSPFGGCGVPLEEQSLRLTIISTLIEPPFQLACSFLVPKRGGASSRSSPKPCIVEFHGFTAGAHSGKVPRPPAVVDSSSALV